MNERVILMNFCAKNKKVALFCKKLFSFMEGGKRDQFLVTPRSLLACVFLKDFQYESNCSLLQTFKMAMAEELLGGGLDIDGWSFLKNEVQSKINEMTDRSLILRSTFPLILKSKFKKEEEVKQAYDIVAAVMEMKSTIEPPWIGIHIFLDISAH